jgi:hypothetical protein
MSDATTTLISLSQRLADLQRRMVEVEAERAMLAVQIETLQQQMAAAIPPARGSTNRSQVLWLLRRDATREYSPLDIWQMLGRTSGADLNNIRVTLSRLAREGAVERVGHGRYRIPRAG